MLRALQFFCAAVMLPAALGAAQNATPPPVQPAAAATLIKTVHIIENNGFPAVEVLSSGARIIPQIQTLSSPPRLIIDLPNSRLVPAARRTSIQKQGIQAILAYQYQKRPPITRIILDFAAPYTYTWDAADKRLIVHLKPPGTQSGAAAENTVANPPSPAPAQSVPTVSGLFPRAAPVALPVTGGSGAALVAGKRLAAGSSLTAGSETAVLRLSRGGDVYVCPGTSVSVTPSHNQRDLLLGMSVGGLEAHYSLRAAADSVLTPDFRIMFSGPGHFDFAISADSHGNTCVRALAGNQSSAIVSELMGDRIYQVRPAEQAVFRDGRIDRVDTEIPAECGCPPPPPVMRAEPYGPPLPDSLLPERSRLGGPSVVSKNGEIGTVFGISATTTMSNGPETAPLPPIEPNANKTPVSVDAPLVFEAKDHPAAPPVPATADLPLDNRPALTMYLEPVLLSPALEPQTATVAPAKAEPHPEHRSFFRRLGGFFASIFRKNSG